MKKRMLALVTAILVLVMSMAGCGAKAEAPAAQAPAAQAPAAQAPAAEAPAAAEEKTLSGDLVLYTSMTEYDIEALLDCFGEKYPDIEVEVVNGSAGELVTRITGEAANPVGDLVWGGISDSDGMANAEIFEAWVSEYDAQNIEGYRSNNGMYSMNHVSAVTFCVNEELEAKLGLTIDSYEDLLDPALKGQILISDPNSSSAAWNNLSNIMAVFGTDSDAAWDYIAKLMPNLVIVGSSSACFKSVQQGEYVCGLTYEDGVATLVKDGADNIRIQYPVDGTSASGFAAALIKNCPNPENAKAMIDFICSAEGQTAMTAYQGGTLRFTNENTEFAEGSVLPASSEIKWVPRDVEYLTENKAAILEHWNDLYASVVG